MSYEILRDDLGVEKKKGKSSSKRGNSLSGSGSSKKRFKKSIKKIHFLFVLFCLIFLFYYFFLSSSDESSVGVNNFKGFSGFGSFRNLDFFSDHPMLVVTGFLNNFSENYYGNINITGGKFIFRSDVLVLNGSNGDFFVSNFNGKILYKNNSVFFIGSADSVKYGSSIVNLNNKWFNLMFEDNVLFNYKSGSQFLNFKEGDLFIEKVLKYSFENGSVTLNNFNGEVFFNRGEFKFRGNISNLVLMTENPYLIVKYVNR